MKLTHLPFSLSLLSLSLASPLVARNTCPSTCTPLSASSRTAIITAFTDSHIIPDVVPSIDPTTALRVRYGSKALTLGNTFGPVETLPEPSFSFDPEPGYDPTRTKYTYIIVDPDAPGPELPLLRQFLHLITYDNKAECAGGKAEAKTLAGYMPLTPLSVAVHRYVYLVYRQPEGAFEPEIDLITLVARAPFNLQEFVNKYNLTLVGGNFMREGLSSALVGLVPDATQDGKGYTGPLDGTAEPENGIGKLLGSVL